MMNIHWIIQENLTKESLVKELQQAVEADGAYADLIKIIPFSEELPEIYSQNRFNIFYGSTTLMLNAAKRYPQGVFYDATTFQMDSYLHHWGNEMLNAQAKLITLGQFSQEDINPTKEFFVRPNDDAKGFSGQVVDFATIQQWVAQYDPNNYSVIQPNLEIIVAPPQNIHKEWRNFVVDGKVVSASRYLLNGQLSKSSEDIPDEMLAYTEARCQEFMPHPIFVMDIALCNGQYKVIECNCFNGTGFYDHDIPTIVQAVNGYIRKKL
ncbi:MAG: ATP-grasp domain-containing protein [Aureispira sp.]|nr:ATP-grasp domain-containing protein [Aureispira sp.]